MSLKKNENIGVNLNRLEICVDKDTFLEACDRAYQRERKRIRVPGFRLGKAPKKVIEKLYGKEVFYEDAIDIVYGKALDDAISESKLDVVSVKDFNLLYVNDEEGLSFTIDCILKPVVEVKNYKGIEIEKPVRKVKEEDIDKRIMNLRERAARIVLLEEERPAKEGDLAVIDFKGFVDGISLKGGEGKDYNLKLGSKQFIKGFEEQVEGHNIGDEFDVNVTFPEDYYDEEIRGKDAKFKCKLKGLKKVELPAEDDEFAKDVSEFESLKELREDIRKKIEKSNEDVAENYVENTVLTTVVNSVEGEIPEVMFKNKYEDLLKDFKRRVEHQGVSFEQYMIRAGLDEDRITNEIKEKAVFQVKLSLALETIAKTEKLEVSEEELKKEMEDMAKQYGMKVEEIEKIFYADLVKKDILNNKAIKFVKDNAKITEKVEE